MVGEYTKPNLLEIKNEPMHVNKIDFKKQAFIDKTACEKNI